MSRICPLAVLLALTAVLSLTRASVATPRRHPAAAHAPGHHTHALHTAAHKADRSRTRSAPRAAAHTPAVSRVAAHGRAHAGTRVQRVDIRSGRQRSTRRSTQAEAHAARDPFATSASSYAGNPGPRGATPQDFLDAAAANQSAHAGRNTVVPALSRQLISAPVAKPASVVSLIRPTSQRPQLPSITEAVEDPIVLPVVTSNRGRLLMPAPLRGSHEILLHQNQMADDDGLGRVQDDADLDAMRHRGMLVPVAEDAAVHIDDRLPENRRFCRPWTAQFLATLARAHYARFHTPLQLNSAVRTVAFQNRLIHTNGNAAPALGETASPHLTGQAIDLGKRGLSLTEIAWMRGYLLPLIESGKIDVEEEFRQSCFHISVYRRYLPPETGPDRYTVASRGMTPALATSLP